MFKKVMFKMTKSLVMAYVLGMIKKESFKIDLIKQINDRVDIPGLNEDQEKKILDVVYDTVSKALEEKYE